MQQNNIQQWICAQCDQQNKYYLRICPGCGWGKEKFYKPMQMELRSEFYQNHNTIGVIDFTFNTSEDRKEILEIIIASIELGEIEHKIVSSKQYLIKPFLIPILKTDEFTQKQIDEGITFNEAVQNIRKDIVYVVEGREKAFVFLEQCQTFQVDCPIKQFIELGRVYPKINGIISLNAMMKDLKIPYDNDCFILAEVVDELLCRSYRFHESMIGTLKNPIPEEKDRIKGFKYFIVLDFEATAQEQKQKRAKQEIIEIGLQVLNIDTQNIEQEYQAFVKPTEQPILSQFNIEFNGISQDQVDNGISLEQMIIDLEKIVNNYQTCCIVTVGDFDLNQLKQEAQRKGLALPQELRYYINLTKAFNSQMLSLTSMLERLGLEFEGNAHRAMVDVMNTVKIAQRVELNELMISYTFKI